MMQLRPAGANASILVDASAMDSGHVHRGIGRYASCLSEALMLHEEVARLRLNWKGAEPTAKQWILPRRQTSHLIRFGLNEVFLKRELEGTGIRLFHTTEPWTLPPEEGWASVATVHDVIPLMFPEHYTRGWDHAKWRVYYAYIRLQRRFQNLTHVIAISEATRELSIEFLGIDPAKISVVYNGVDHEQFFPPSKSEIEQVRRNYGLPERFVLYLGGYDYRKNVPQLISAMARVQSKSAGLALVLAGAMSTKEKREMHERAVREGVMCEFLGFVDDAHLRGLYGAATLFAYPSLAEGFGLQVLEAMASGCPVVTSETTSLGEVAHEAGKLVDPTDVVDIAEAIQSLASSHTEQERYRRAGLKRAKEFSWTRCANETWEVYCRVLEMQK